MNDKQNAIDALDRAIDRGDMREIDRCLEALSSIEGKTIAAEDPKLFSARILQLNKENRPMKHSRKAMRLALAAALVAALGISVYAAANLHLLSFLTGDQYVTVRTNESITEQEARQLVEEGQRETDADPSSQGANAITLPPEQTFASVAEAEAAMDMRLIVPSAMPEMKLESIEGQTFYSEAGYQNSTVWIVYSDEAGRMLGITTNREIIPEGTPVTSYTLHEVDEGSQGSYKSKNGLTFTTVTESDESGGKTAQIATVLVGEYEYSLVFFGFEEQEWKSIVDSADLSAYQR